MKFADDPKVRDILDMEGDGNTIQEDLDNLGSQSSRNRVKFNRANCKLVPLRTKINFCHKLQGHHFRNTDM